MADEPQESDHNTAVEVVKKPSAAALPVDLSAVYANGALVTDGETYEVDAADEFQLFECVLPENVYAAVIVAWLNQRNGSVRRHRIESQRARVHMHKA